MTQDIKLALERGKIAGAKQLLKEYYEAQDKAEFYGAMRAEYDTLYKTVETIVDAVIDDDGSELIPATSYFDYVDGCPTFEAYRDEVVVVSPEVEATYDADGVELTPAVAEVTEMVRPYVAPETYTRVNAYIKESTMPKIVTMRQARLALLKSGLLETIEQAIANSGNDELVIEWEYATDVRRDWKSLEELVNSLGMTDTQLDDLFILAGTL